MVEAPPEGFLCFYRDVEGLGTIPEFVEATYRDAAERLGKRDRWALRFRKLLESVGGSEIAGVKLAHFELHWKTLFNTLIEDLCKDDAGRRVAFFWDELPLFIFKLYKRDPKEAMEFLDVLRALRQTHFNLRMIFTGSVGLHTVLDHLHRLGYANRPVNDMNKITVPPLAAADGVDLALRLIDGAGLLCGDQRAAMAATVANAAGHVPFYIHWILSRLPDSNGILAAADIERAVADLIGNPADPADFRYFDKRFDSYYDPAEAALARAILRALASADSPASLADLVKRAPRANPDRVRDVLRILAEDHYINRDEAGYSFRNPLIKRWWRWKQG